MIMGAIMTETTLLRLMTLLSPSFPIGAFSYSHGLEYAVEAQMVVDAMTLEAWLEDILLHGSGRADGVLFVASWQARRTNNDKAWQNVVELGHAFAPSAELAMETRNQGAAFLKAVRGTWPTKNLQQLDNINHGKIVYPVAVGAVCAAHDISLSAGLTAYLHGFTTNIISAGVRLIPLGQNAGLRVIANMESHIHHQVGTLLRTTLDDLCSSTPLADICSMRHETLATRIFRS